ncbi:MAG TPA: flavoprotein [Herpetosiphon sp.]|uniref:Secreted protein n=1 Tax=Herpetosiphon aurantiacus (strain ATCC 23779 / DSM 785 / 114-95) TaxID=316274 RepID=A9B2L1_HERA2|nr:NAD(P)-binding domain-containing protein [Herpetosiphon sp.]ABX05462.1 putative secreted protein [Herpetosiphon aurantiacus DSM 785]HBW52843.1 flavoprotein [Herpetosiphon sp.]
MDFAQLPVAVIGSGPVGLAAAAHLLARNETPIIFEAGSRVADSVQRWGHVRLFSAWEFNIDPVAEQLLIGAGWQTPNLAEFPTGAELVRDYLQPLAQLPQIQLHLKFNSKVVAITRLGLDKLKNAGRATTPFVLTIETVGATHQIYAKAVIDASGTYRNPNPLGVAGVPALGETAANNQIYYGIPDILGNDRARYANRSVAVVGSGHSAFNALLDLAELAEQAPETSVTWIMRRGQVDAALYGGGANDQLVQRGLLGGRVEQLVASGRFKLVTGFGIERITQAEGKLDLQAGERQLTGFDQLIATTGFRPDLSMLSEIRLDLDAAVESPRVLAPLIDPNEHSCGTVRPHGAEELQQPEPNFYIVGMKSYGRAPTFLMRTGYEQVRSVVAALVGDWQAAREVQLVLPETGVCKTQFGGEACCGTTPTRSEILLQL